MAAIISVTAADFIAIVRQRLAFDQGRALAIAKARARLAPRQRVIREELDRDLIANLPAHGRASRIARRTRIPRRTVARIMATLMSMANL